MDTPSKKPKSLYRELTMALVVLVSLVSIAVNLLNYLYLSRDAEELYESKSSEYAARLRQSLEWPLWNIDDELIQKIGSAYVSNAEIALLTIRDDQRRVIYRYEKSNGDQVSNVVPIKHNGQDIGSVEIGLSLSVYEERDRQLLLVSIVTIVLLIVSLLGATRWILSRLLKKPIDTVIGATRDMVEGRYSQIELQGTYTEFASILSGFRTMSDAVANRESSLRESNEKLTAEVIERKHAEEALRASEERLHLATTAGNIGIWDWDIVNNVLTWDESMYVLYGIRQEDFGGAYDAWINTLHPDDRQYTDGEIQAALRGEREYAPEFRIVRPDGVIRVIKADSKTYRDPSGRPIRMIGINIDISERKRAEEVIRSAAQYARSLIESTLDPLVTISADGKITDVNTATESITGVGRADLIGSDFADYFTDPEKAREGYKQVFSQGFVTNYPLAIRHVSGKVTDVLYNASVYRDSHGNIAGVFAAARDITELKRTEEELRRYKDHLEDEVQQRTADLVLARNAAEAANKAKSVFLASMSHELRTPLNAILGFSNMMRKDPLLSQEQRDNLDIINRSGEHLLTLINDVLEMAKIEAGRVQLESAPFDLGILVRDVTDMMHARAEERGLRLLIDQSSEFPRYIRGDEARLRQVLINLVGNAVKFTQQGGVTVRLGLKPHALQQRLLIEVEDSGVGIKPEDQQKIFEPFVQLGQTATQKGTGLGLTITRQFVQLMGGAISVESTPGKGSIFRVELPVDRVEATDVVKPEGVERGEIVGLAPGQPEYRILIVEDQLENQLLLSKLMKTIGFPVKVAENGEQALALFQSWRPDIIWMDRRMPVMDGIEATRRIRALADGKEVKIVAVTASAFKEQRDEMLSAGMDDFVRKPYRFNEIYDCLSRQLGVKYTYAEEQGAEDASVEALTAEMLAVLPPELRGELREALESLEGERIAAVIRQVAPYDSKLHKMLSHLAVNFDYPAILNVLQTNPSENAT